MHLKFGNFVLDLDGCELTVGGKPASLERRPTELLCVLAESPGVLVTREHLARRIWGTAALIDADMGINTAIRKIRVVLGDNPAKPMFIETVQGRGYRFMAPLQSLDTNKTSISTIAVLPFDNLTGSDSHAYIADGFTEEMIASLGLVQPSRIQVIGRRSVMMCGHASLPLAEIGARLNAGHLLESAIRSEGDRLRVTTKLIDAPRQSQIWSAAYDGPRDGLLAFQQEVSSAVGAEIRRRLAPDTISIATGRHTANENAFDLYLRGRFCGNRYVSATNQEAIGYFEQATALDPGYALAWAGMAEIYAASPVNGDVPAATIWRHARHAAEMALRAGPRLAEAQAAMGFVRFWLDWDWLAAEADFRRAATLDPNYAFAHRMLGVALSHLGRHAAAAAAMRHAVRLDPLYAMHYALSAMLAFQAGDYAGGIAFGRQAITIDPRFWIGHFHLAQSLEQAGDQEEALRVLETAASLSGTSTKPLMLQGYILARQGRTNEARARLAVLQEVARDRFVPPYAAALISAGLGDGTAAIAALEGSLALRDVNLAFLPHDPKWNPLRTDPRFVSVLKRCGFAEPSPGSETPIVDV